MEENEVKDDIQIAEEVISSVAGIAIKDMEGVAKLAGGLAEGISEAFGKKNFGKGIKVEITEKNVKLEVNIFIKYGVKIPDIAAKIQEKIKEDVESMTGYKVLVVNVKVQGIETELEEKITGEN